MYRLKTTGELRKFGLVLGAAFAALSLLLFLRGSSIWSVTAAFSLLLIVTGLLFPTLLRSADFGDAVDASVGELFGLPGFEPRSETGTWNDVTLPAFRKSFTDLVSERFVVSSRTLAAVAVAGRPDAVAGAFSSLGDLEITSDRVGRRGRTLRWKSDVHPGDLLVEGDHWWVLLGDDGNGELDPADPVLHCWGRPPERTTLWASLETETITVRHLRYAD